MFSHLFNTYEAVTPPPKFNTDFEDTYQILREDNPVIDSLDSLKLVPTFEAPSVDRPLIQPFIPQLQVDTLPQKKQDSSTTSNTLSEPKKTSIIRGPKLFEEAFKEAEKMNPEISKYKTFLTKIAKRESNFNPSIQNTSGAPYYGFFQMGRQEIRQTTGLTVHEFRSNPVKQILGAVELYKHNLKVMKSIGAYDLGKQKGYSEDALVAGAWLGGPGGVKKYLLGKGNPSDSHWYGGKGGTSVGRRMNEFNE